MLKQSQKNMKRLIFFSLLLISTLCFAENDLVTVGQGFSGTSVNAAIFRKNSIVSQDKWQFVAYYDNDGYVCIGKRKIGADMFQVTRSHYKGNINDAHNIISIGIDGDGFLHVAFDHHDSRLHYCRSAQPYSTVLSDLESMVGRDEEKVTYPEFYTLRGVGSNRGVNNGDLIFVYRSGKSGQGNLIMNRYDFKRMKWERVQDVLIDGEGQRSAYWQMNVDANGVIHLSWVWRDSWLVETNHDLCYACSRDGGKTWRKSTGEKYKLPINAENAEYAFRIPQNSELINQTSIAADKNSMPYIATYWKATDDAAPQYKIVYKQNDKWTLQNVGHRTQDFSLSGGGTKLIPMSRPQLVVTGKKDKVKAYYIYRDTESGSKVTIAKTDNVLSGQWVVTQPHDIVVDAWEPSFDTNLWNEQSQLNIFVQRVQQGDGEKTIPSAPQKVMVLNYK